MNAQQKIETKTDFNEVETVAGSTVFPDIYSSGSTSKVLRRKNRHPDCIASNPDYVPNEKVLRRVLAWWHNPQLQPLGLHGETGTGKTELFLYIADRLNEPVYMIQVHPGLMPEDMEGHKELVDGRNGVVTRNKLGLAAKAYYHGGLMLLDETDKGNTAFHSSLHGLIEGKPWTLEQFGKTILKHSQCRIVGTANTMGEGGHERYHTSQRMDAALRGRFGWIQTQYPEPALELKILSKKLTSTKVKLPQRMLKDMVRLANAMRDALLGADRKGIDTSFNAVFSTRTLVNWLHYMIVFGQEANWNESLDFVFAGSIDPESKGEVEDIIQRVLGELPKQPLSSVMQEYSQMTV